MKSVADPNVYLRTYGEDPNLTDVTLTYRNDKGETVVVPAEHIGGIAQVVDVLGPKFVEQYPNGIPRQVISNWAARRATTGFPRALPLALERGLLWDLREVAAWDGPPGRWPGRKEVTS